ncbi:MAG: type II and III secretion system protein [bacterium]|nr:type II and III secretion system protein [bacterium]
MKHALRTRAGLAILLMTLAATATFADESAGGGETSMAGNVQVTFRLGTFEDGKPVPLKTYDLIVYSGGRGSKLLSGSRVPLPATKDEDSQAIVYQNVGFSTEVLAWILDKKTIKLMANIENSRVIPDENGGPPSVETRQVSVSALLEPGKPLELTRVEGISDKPGYVEVSAKIVD